LFLFTELLTAGSVAALRVPFIFIRIIHNEKMSFHEWRHKHFIRGMAVLLKKQIRV